MTPREESRDCDHDDRRDENDRDDRKYSDPATTALRLATSGRRGGGIKVDDYSAHEFTPNASGLFYSLDARVQFTFCEANRNLIARSHRRRVAHRFA